VPQSEVQKIAATMMAKDDSPVLEPYSHGSMTLLLMSSASRKSPITHISIDQPGSTAKARPRGKSAARNGPRYGKNRSTAASRP
jgi:hypothetical protein